MEHTPYSAMHTPMLTELYEFSMADGYFSNGMENTVACFDLFFRRVPD